jgi:hypothetical protein
LKNDRRLHSGSGGKDTSPCERALEGESRLLKLKPFKRRGGRKMVRDFAFHIAELDIDKGLVQS